MIDKKHRELAIKAVGSMAALGLRVDCGGASSATSLLPRPEDEPSPAAGRPRYPDTRRCACGNQLMVREDRRTGRCGVCRMEDKPPVSERSERSG